MLTELRLENFKCFPRARLRIKPLTFLLGPNSSGKTSVFQALLLLKQTLESTDRPSPLVFRDPSLNYVDMGGWESVIWQHKADLSLVIGLSFGDGRDIRMKFGCRRGSEKVVVEEVVIKPTKYGKARSFNLPFLLNPTMVPAEDAEELIAEIERLSLFAEFKDLERKFKRRKGDLRIFFWFQRVLQEHLALLSHIGPLRRPLPRTMDFHGTFPKHVGQEGEWLPQVMIGNWKHLQNKVNKWFKKLKISAGTHLIPLGKDVYQLELTDPKTKARVNIVDAGLGASQVLPIIAEGFLSPPGAMLLLEQPEMHLHPPGQLAMGDLLLEVAGTGKTLLIETHSDLLLGRVRRRIAEGKLSPEDVAVYYFKPRRKGTTVSPIELSENGSYVKVPPKFFEEGFHESWKRMEIIRQHKKSAQGAGKSG